jgi:hypothetical protein
MPLSTARLLAAALATAMKPDGMSEKTWDKLQKYIDKIVLCGAYDFQMDFKEFPCIWNYE